LEVPESTIALAFGKTKPEPAKKNNKKTQIFLEKKPIIKKTMSFKNFGRLI
jgi:hypothetical protein